MWFSSASRSRTTLPSGRFPSSWGSRISRRARARPRDSLINDPASLVKDLLSAKTRSTHVGARGRGKVSSFSFLHMWTYLFLSMFRKLDEVLPTLSSRRKQRYKSGSLTRISYFFFFKTFLLPSYSSTKTIKFIFSINKWQICVY